ncbi:hypothetical protein C0J52_14802 [Blattella germanica]|nr:hypothetical protein C0J52_14802 [Blattella germanica]
MKYAVLNNCARNCTDNATQDRTERCEHYDNRHKTKENTPPNHNIRNELFQDHSKTHCATPNE